MGWYKQKLIPRFVSAVNLIWLGKPAPIPCLFLNGRVITHKFVAVLVILFLIIFTTISSNVGWCSWTSSLVLAWNKLFCCLERSQKWGAWGKLRKEVSHHALSFWLRAMQQKSLDTSRSCLSNFAVNNRCNANVLELQYIFFGLSTA